MVNKTYAQYAAAANDSFSNKRDNAPNSIGYDGDYWGDDQTIEVTIGEFTGTFRGSHSGIRTNHTVGHSTHIYPGISGDFVGCKLRLNGTFYFAQKNGFFEGVLHNPKGE